MTPKEVCRKCTNEGEFAISSPWTSYEDRVWENEQDVWCVALNCWIPIKDVPPPDCIYAAEHVVLREKKS